MENGMEKIGGVILNDTWYTGDDAYSDGDAAEEKLLSIVKEGGPYSYAMEEYVEWPVLYHLSRQRENIAAPMDIRPGDTVLELGAGPGAVTGALARMAGKVECIELSKRRSLINAYRHQDMDNIEIYVGNYKDIPLTKQYDVITFIGVLEYAAYYVGGQDPYREVLKKMYSQLREGGRLYIAIENKLGMKYFAGYHEDHLGRAFAGIEGYSKDDHVRTFTMSELRSLLKDAGFKDGEITFWYPFPDYKLPTVIYSEKTIRDADLEFEEYANYDMPIIHLFDQNKAFAGLKGTEERKLFANSFLIEARRGQHA